MSNVTVTIAFAPADAASAAGSPVLYRFVAGRSVTDPGHGATYEKRGQWENADPLDETATGSLVLERNSDFTPSGSYWQVEAARTRWTIQLGASTPSRVPIGAVVVTGVEPPATYPDPATFELVARKGQASGYAELGSDGTVPLGQLPPLGGAPSGAAGGDLSGTYPNPTVPGLAGKADLVGGKVPTSQIPAIALVSATVVASQAAMLALTAEPGDLAIRSDLSATFVLAASPASTLANWLQLATPTDHVLSVNGQIGVVVLAAGDIGLPAGTMPNLAGFFGADPPNTQVGLAETDTAIGFIGTALSGKADTSVTDALDTRVAALEVIPVRLHPVNAENGPTVSGDDWTVPVTAELVTHSLLTDQVANLSFDNPGTGFYAEFFLRVQTDPGDTGGAGLTWPVGADVSGGPSGSSHSTLWAVHVEGTPSDPPTVIAAALASELI